MKNKKKLPIGTEFFREFKRDGFYYVDKTGFIRELINSRGRINLITRPRRFGKSLNMDMLKTFFEIGTDTELFDGLEIAKETALCGQYMGKFTGLNNFKVRTISDCRFAEYFGFTAKEVKELLHYYDLEEKFEVLKEWYDGYHFGDQDIYCPWDVINQCDKFIERKDAPMEAHWENSSSNAIVQDILASAAETTKNQIEALISGEAVEKVLIPELTYTDLDNEDSEIRQTYLWSVLFSSGYLTDAGRPENGIHKLVIPNREVRGIYEKRVRSWFKRKDNGALETRWDADHS